MDVCAGNGCSRKVYAHGFCTKHYQRWRKHGDPDYERITNSEKTCKVDGCESSTAKAGFCNRHYIRNRRHGDPHATKLPDDWGDRMVDPRWGRWQYHLRESKAGVVPEWEDFDAFKSGVGEQPGGGYILMKVVPTDPIGPDNFVWVEKVEDRMEYLKQWKRNNPDKQRRYRLKKEYGVTPEWYDETFAAQGNGCAICGGQCKKIEDGHQNYMAIDHCHGTGRVRGILCNDCNLAIGHMKDDPATLRAAADYLDRYQHSA